MTNKVILPIQSSYLLSVKVILIPLFMCVCPKNTMVYRMAYVQNVLACFLKMYRCETLHILHFILFAYEFIDANLPHGF